MAVVCAPEEKRNGMNKRRLVALLLCVTQVLFPANDFACGSTEVKAQNGVSVNVSKDISELEGGEKCTTSLGEVVCLGEAAAKMSARNGVLFSIKYSAGVQVDNVQSEFCMESAKFGKILDTQMRNFLNNNTVDAARIEKADETAIAGGLQSFIVFDMTEYEFMIGDGLLLWVMDAISVYPSLASAMSYVKYSYYPMENDAKRLAYLYLGTPLSESEIKNDTKEYEIALANLVNKPLNASEMSDEEKILYIHDRLINIAQYRNDGGLRCHLPLAVLLDSYGVCQSYGNIFNHAMTILGYDCVLLCSSTHSWNAIRLGDKWYYIDVTWDDPISKTSTPLLKAYALHDYMLVQENSFSDSHTLDEQYEKVYGSITDNFGTAYDDFFPKTKSITRSLWYYDGKWYYSQNGVLYSWETDSDYSRWIMSASYNSKRNVIEFNDKLYYSGSDGLYEYTGNESTIINSYNIDDIYLKDGRIAYVSDDVEYLYGYVPTPTPIPTVEPTAVPTAVPTAIPTAVPTAIPTATPTIVPTAKPTVKPTAVPTVEPTVKPTSKPTVKPTAVPTVKPTVEPTVKPTTKPTTEPMPTPTVKPTAVPTLKPTAKPTETPVATQTPIASTPHPKGYLLHYEKGIYRVVVAEAKDEEDVIASVSFVKPLGNVKAFKIPDAINVDGYVYDVVAIEPKAFKGQKSLVKVTISDTVESIGKKAFAGCKKLRNIIIESKKYTKSRIGTGCFKGVTKKAFMKVPKKKKTVYAKMFKKKGFKGKVIK